MENTLKNKSAFFAQYWGQMILLHESTKTISHVGKTYMTEQGVKVHVLRLKALSSITNKDAIEVAKLVYPDNENWSKSMQSADKGESFIEDTFYSYEDSFSVFGINDPMGKIQLVTDYLRSKSYALPYLGLSVDNLAEYGWIKLTA